MRAGSVETIPKHHAGALEMATNKKVQLKFSSDYCVVTQHTLEVETPVKDDIQRVHTSLLKSAISNFKSAVSMLM